jgi:hypothetical protein
MGSIVDRQELIRRHMRIFLRGAQRRMAKHFLYRSEVCAFVEQVRRARMPQGMRAHCSTNEATRIPRDHSSDASCREPPPSMIQEQWSRQRGTEAWRTQRLPIVLNRLEGHVSDRNDPFLTALSSEAHESVHLIEVAEIDPHGLTYSGTGRVQGFQQGTIA